MKDIYKPKVLEIELSHLCNLRCAGCAILPDVIAHKCRLSQNILITLLQQAENLGFTGYSLTGGEPMLHFPLILDLIKVSALDLYKINTNGFMFATDKSTCRVFEDLREAGFGRNNTTHISFINVSVGQQTAAGIPLMNAVRAAKRIGHYFSSKEAKFTLNSFSENKEYATHVIDQFLHLYEQTTGHPFDTGGRSIKLILSGSWYGELDATKNQQTPVKKVRIKDLVNYFDANNYDIINCSTSVNDPHIAPSFPRMLVRANGDVYSCTGFAYSHRLGSIYKDSLAECVKRANDNPVLRLRFGGKGLKEVLKKAEHIDPTIGERIVSTSLNPCHLCAMFSGIIRQHSIVVHT